MFKIDKSLVISFLVIVLHSFSAFAATSIPFTVNMSEAVNVTGTPRIAVDVGGVTRYATYTSGTGSSALTFTYAMVAGDVDLDGVTLTSPIDLNGGTMKDLRGNDLSPLTYTLPNTSNVKVNYPSLGMDFIYDADGRYTLNGTVYNDLTSFLSAAGGTFTRASTATYYDSTGTLQTAASGAPRFDYDPVTHTAKGILIEESRTNILTQSKNFSGWTNNNSSTVTPNAVASPDGTTNATTISSSTMFSGIFNKGTVANGNTYTQSVYIKYVSGSSTSARLGCDTINGYIQVNPQTMTITSVASSVTSSNVTNIGNGWYRFSWRFSATSTGDYAFVIYNATSSALNFSAYGAQFEQGSFSTSYIPTTTATVTRVADVLTIPTASWYNTNTGTMMTQYNIPYMGGTAYPGSAVFYDGTANNGITLYIADAFGDLRRGQVRSGGTNSFDQSALSAYTTGTTTKSSLAYATNDANISMDGVLATADTSVTIPTVTTLRVGGANNGITSALNGWIGTFKYYPSRIPDAQLQLLTQ